MTVEPISLALPNFKDTRIAFQNKSDHELKFMALLFRLMNNSFLVDAGTSMTKLAFKLRVPFVQTVVKKTIFKQFCGGVNLMDCQEVIDHLYKHNALAILDYGAESKSKEADIDIIKEELLNAIEFAASNNSVPGISSKLTALVDNYILEKKQSQADFTPKEQVLWDNFIKRVHEICTRAKELGVGIFIDAEESWMQDTMDEVVNELMEKYNRKRVIVFNTYQLYLKNKLQQLKDDSKRAKEKGFLLGAKLVRGAYMDKEREIALENGYPSPIQDTKEDTDRDFNEALLFCLDRYKTISFCCASHNLASNLLLAEEVIVRKLPRDHPHINFCQLQGMSDYITFNLATAGFNVAKYVVYGPVKEVIDYLIRRAEENTAVTGEMSRELQLITKEIKRRRL